jgi:hypothetical protein
MVSKRAFRVPFVLVINSVNSDDDGRVGPTIQPPDAATSPRIFFTEFGRRESFTIYSKRNNSQIMPIIQKKNSELK